VAIVLLLIMFLTAVKTELWTVIFVFIAILGIDKSCQLTIHV